MALRSEFALGNSEYNDFLYAPIGDEGNDRILSVLSALARLDIDPWREAALLSELSREKAVQVLAPILARIPGGRWKPDDVREIAARLVAFLPQHTAVAPVANSARLPAAHGVALPAVDSAGDKAKLNSRTLVLLAVLVFSVLSMAISAIHPPSGQNRVAPTATSGAKPKT